MARDDPSHLVVVFLKGEPQAAAVEALRGKIKGPEEGAAGPGCLYASYPDDIGHSKLTAEFLVSAAADHRSDSAVWTEILSSVDIQHRA